MNCTRRTPGASDTSEYEMKLSKKKKNEDEGAKKSFLPSYFILMKTFGCCFTFRGFLRMYMKKEVLTKSSIFKSEKRFLYLADFSKLAQSPVSLDCSCINLIVKNIKYEMDNTWSTLDQWFSTFICELITLHLNTNPQPK